MKRVYAQVIVLSIFLLLSINLVSAGPLDDLIEGSEKGIKAVFNVISPIIEAVFGEVPTKTSEVTGLLIAKILLFIIVLALIYTIVEKINFLSENTFILWVITIAVSLLATRWLSSNAFVATVILPYNALGMALAVFLPLFLIFYFLEVVLKGPEYLIMRKIGWVLVAVLFTMIWFVRYEAITALKDGYAIWFYPVAALVCILMVFLEPWYIRMMTGLEASRMHAHSHKKLADRYQGEYDELEKMRDAAARRYQHAEASRINQEMEKLLKLIRRYRGSSSS